MSDHARVTRLAPSRAAHHAESFGQRPAAALFDTDGAPLGMYRKMHIPGTVEPRGVPPYALERRYFERLESPGNVHHAEIDPDMEPVRGNPRFVAMLSSAKQRLGIADAVAG